MNYNFQETLTRVWEKAVDLYQGGQRDSSTFPIDDDLPFLSLLGMNKMDVFDYAEDWVLEGTPDLATFLLIHEQRRDYFIEVQKRTPSSKTLDTVLCLPKRKPLKESIGSRESSPKPGLNFVVNCPLLRCFVVAVTATFFKPMI